MPCQCRTIHLHDHGVFSFWISLVLRSAPPASGLQAAAAPRGGLSGPSCSSSCRWGVCADFGGRLDGRQDGPCNPRDQDSQNPDLVGGIRAILDWTRALHRAHRRTWHRCHGNCGQNRRCVDLRFSSGSYMQQAAIKLSIIKIHRRRREFGGRCLLYNYSVYMQNLKRPTASH